MDEEEIFQEHITVDLTGCQNVMEFWNRIKIAFQFPDFFGKNWSAFWDLLARECPAHSVTVIGANTLPADWETLKGIHYAQMLRKMLHKNQQFKAENNYAFSFEFIDT